MPLVSMKPVLHQDEIEPLLAASAGLPIRIFWGPDAGHPCGLLVGHDSA
jgi:hypothetical protein